MANVSVTTIGGNRSSEARKEPAYTMETVTPDIAKEWLALNTHNRSQARGTIARYARDMANDAWAFTADPIRFNGRGQLIDGQHRLLACLASGKPFQTLVVRGLPVSVQEKLDQGKARSAGDHLNLRGVAAGKLVAAAARHLIGIKYGIHAGYAGGGQGSGSMFGRATNAEVLAMVDKHPGLVDSIGAEGIGKVMGIAPSLIAAIHYIGAHLLDERDIADQFVGVFASGEPTYEGDAAHLWRERLVAQETKKAKLRSSSRRIGTIHAWNLFRRREPLRVFRIPDTLPAIEDLNTDLL